MGAKKDAIIEHSCAKMGKERAEKYGLVETNQTLSPLIHRHRIEKRRSEMGVTK